MTLAEFDVVDDGGRHVSRVRAFVAQELQELDRTALTDDAVLVASELASNAMLHAGGIAAIGVTLAGDAVRIEVHDRTRIPPVMARQSTEAMTGRGLRLVAAISRDWGAEPTEDGKVVWAELTETHTLPAVDPDDLLELWEGDGWFDDERTVVRHAVTLGEVPTALLLSAKAHVDNLVREFTLAARGAESNMSAEVPPDLALLIETVVNRFSEARQSIKRQALAAANQGLTHVRLKLHLPTTAADAGEEYLRALDEADAYCHAARLLTIESAPQHRLFRQWYVGELVAQLRAAEAGTPAPAPERFEERLLREFGKVATAHAASERVARLYQLSTALSRAATHEAVANAVLTQGVAALSASGGALLLATHAGRLAVPGALGYDEQLVERLRRESPQAVLPAAVALRTGEPVWIESRQEREARFPELVDFEPQTVSMCAVPLVLGDNCLGALRFSFPRPRLFDEEERRFVIALAAQTSRALGWAQLYEERLEFSRRLQLSLFPRRLAGPPQIDIAGVYHSLGDGTELGGDIYDMWPMQDGLWGIAIADAAGTGPEAAALTAMVRFSLRALATTDVTPVSVIDKLNRALLGAEVGGLGGERFCTAIFGVLRPGPTSTVALAGGGHPPPVVRRADGSVEEIDVGGALLGVFEDVTFGSNVVSLDAGDTLVLYTDGVIEARRRSIMFGIEGLRGAVAASRGDAAAMASAIERAVLDYNGGVVSDDLAVLVVQGRAQP